MSESVGYRPSSEFLRKIFSEEIELDELRRNEDYLQQLIDLTSDAEARNRDWSVMFLGQLELDRPEVFAALVKSADDTDEAVRGEAISGLVHLDRALALTLVQRELRSESVNACIFEAAEKLADPSLIEDLEYFQEPGDSSFVDSLAAAALAACERNLRSSHKK